MARLVMLIAAALLQVPQVPPASSANQVRFHHLHYRVIDPLGAMRQVGGASGAGPTILQGLGVGVSVGSEYALFDRIGDEAGPPTRVAIATAYPAIVAWFRGRGVELSPDASRAAALSARLPDQRIDHVAFATPNLPETLARLTGAGVHVTTRNDESAMIDTAVAGLRIEIVRDLDLPDLFWCPMHPDVRSAVEGACPICRMTLVPIPTWQSGEYHADEYHMDVTPTPANRGGGLSGLRLRIGYPDSGPPASRVFRDGQIISGPSFISVHDKRLHLFIVSRSLEYFAHVHPDQAADGSFDLRYDIPPGEYMLIADFLPADGAPQLVQRAIVTPGYDPPARVNPVEPVPVRSVAAEGFRATLEAGDLTAGRPGTLSFTLSDSRTGAPVTDLEPYLSAPAHALLVSADLTFAVHGHPREQDAFGPALSFEFLAPAPGLYKMWLQVQRHGRVLTLPFVLRVG